MVCLSCTGTGERVCLSAEGFGNRHCFLEGIADRVSLLIWFDPTRYLNLYIKYKSKGPSIKDEKQLPLEKTYYRILKTSFIDGSLKKNMGIIFSILLLLTYLCYYFSRIIPQISLNAFLSLIKPYLYELCKSCFLQAQMAL